MVAAYTHSKFSFIVTGWANNGGSNQKVSLPGIKSILMETDDRSFLQWILNWTGDSWTFRNQYSGGYLGINSSSPADGVPLIAQSSPFNWDIWPDAINPNAYR
jgi:hypothetical protein